MNRVILFSKIWALILLQWIGGISYVNAQLSDTMARTASYDKMTVIVSGKLALCSHSERGSIVLTVQGGKAPYKFKWNNNDTSQNRVNLYAGTYTVWITDADGQMITESIVIQPPFPLILNPVDKRDASCGSGQDGYARISVKIGRGEPYQVTWSNGLKNVWEADNLAPGTYVVTVADRYNCDTSISFEIKAASEGISVSESIQNISCSSSQDGNIQLNVTGGQTPYTFKWSNGATTKDISNLSPGTYQVQVTDAKGCSFQASYAVQAASQIQILDDITQPSCTGSASGSIKLTVSGGKSPYTYQWSNGSTQSSVQNLVAGTYTVKVTDASGCYSEKQFTLANQSALSLSLVSKSDVLCFGDKTGKLDLNVTGAAGSTTVKWSDGSTTLDRDNLAPGTYTVTVKDQFCEVSSTFQISGPASEIQVSASPQNPSCAGNDGKISLTVSGGTAPYIYAWNNGASTKDLSSLGEGKYEVTITDKNGCSVQKSFDLVSPLPLAYQEEITQPSCAGESTGAIKLTVSGGNAPYTYLWSNGSVQSSAQNLAAGIHQVKITDATGCVVERQFELTNQSALKVEAINVTPVSCQGKEDGAIELTISGAKGNVKFNWSDNSNAGSSRTNLKSGTYEVLISDESGCTISQQVQVAETIQLQARVESTLDVDCESGKVTGRAWVAITGGKEPYTYQWSNTNFKEKEIEFSKSGLLKVKVTDALGCEVEAQAMVTFPDFSNQGARLNFEYRKLVFTNEPEVMVEEEILFESDISPEFIAWEWEFGDGQKSSEKDPIHVFKAPGTYVVKLTGFDIFGCDLQEVNEVVVNQPEEMMVIPNAFSPNGDNLNDTFIPKMRGVDEFNMQVFNLWGEKLYEASGVEASGWDGTYKGQLVPPGNYIYKIEYLTWEGIRKSASGSVSLIR